MQQGVFTYLLENLGVKGVQFEELLSLDAQALAELHPVYGIIFLFKFPTNTPYVSDGGGPRDGQFDYEIGSDGRLFFAQQTIQNACGTQALLSVLLNKASEEDGLDLGPHLRAFREFAMALPPDLRGEALSNDEPIRDVHNSFAKSSPFVDETQRPTSADDADDVYHFIAYTAVDGRLYELDGLQPAPIDHGPCGSGSGSSLPFAEAAIAAVQRRIARYGADEIHFNLLAAVRDRRLQARAFGDADLLAAETRKRRAWQFENTLRRHNFVGFAHEVLEGVVEAKLRQDDPAAYDRWVAEATARIQRRVQEKQRRGVPLGQDVHVEE
ncbi:26S proteasome-associated ubiquitin c-terminal [Grosmannia clavigera kw1407]|uniref:Ubiquitin carboxyl-terminal hydrolase n=1 Tax=Grosmannia clavigera (strain kw1407 / UAMH 11150) TaxID=655863 RepID=F0XM12_GROCL|nr:26S proteasome-associated ubiquitin c-terminal [Grosmannia clavigera kw1407]EFX01516.1 26S proteasome-associated ubiquitin c-terminal [Grosmannia clavigera kw1407]